MLTKKRFKLLTKIHDIQYLVFAYTFNLRMLLENKDEEVSFTVRRFIKKEDAIKRGLCGVNTKTI